ncbi:LysM peptidoglycan-binding domain-containing protein [Flavobacterium psychroterrae]|uniref:LysM peptidoglycan-binding domain-containing protein n=1 Tax=Flavobacterium psychroterrae TaxID=2133767 RepID=A0ABS5PA03_9FLAO|nr:LysM domain-containing protein [Flavobacterium psychroterrae]MBS7231154.1 LysM peptidoglycan-binding domain-containing protein [Flavobacterium psychroterrae]
MDDLNSNSGKEYSLYEIQKGDTLESIAEKLGVDFDDLRQYHNSRSKIEDCLAGDLRSHLKFLIIPNKKEKQKVEEQKVKPVLFFSRDFILPFRPVGVNKKYEVLYTIENGDKKEVVKQQFSVKRLKPDTNQDDYHFFEIDRISKVHINGEIADTVAYKVAEKTGEILYPLRVIVDKSGKWVDINSYYKIKDRWEIQKEEIEDSYDGKVFETLVKEIEGTIHDNNTLLGSISGNWFLRAFFNGIHIAYTDKFVIEKKVYFPAIAEIDDLGFLITQKVNPYLDELNRIIVTQSGDLDEEQVEGNYEANYFLNPNNYMIERLDLECSVIDMERKITVKITNLDKDKIEVDSGISLLV